MQPDFYRPAAYFPGMVMPETLPANTATTLDPQKLATIVVAAEGDLRLAAEMLSSTPADITTSLLASPQAQSSLASNLKTMLLLSLVQLMGEVKTQVLTTLPDFSPRESLEALRLITEGISQLIPAPAPTDNSPSNNTNYIMGDEVASRLINRLSQYRPPSLTDPNDAPSDELEGLIRNG